MIITLKILINKKIIYLVMKKLLNNSVLQARLPQLVEEFINENKAGIEKIVNENNGPVHITFPGIFKNNINILKQSLSNLDFDYKIYFAHKPTKSTQIIKEALKSNIGIDVASLAELEHALSVGFLPSNIECTGIKNHLFLKKAVEIGALISIDSISELEQLADLVVSHNQDVIIRISNPVCSDRKKVVKESRFGILQEDLGLVYKILNKNQKITLKGFHFHNDERDLDVKAEYIINMLDLIKEAAGLGHSPEIINIGGGWRVPELENLGQWENFINQIEIGLLKGINKMTWRGFSYGMHLNDKGRVSGREKIQGKFINLELAEAVSQLFNYTSKEGIKINEVIADSFLTVMTEPGYFLMNQVGISFAKVVSISKGVDGKNRLALDANMYNFSTQMREMFLDPLLIKDESSENNSWQGFLVGNLCREEDIIMKRIVRFEHKPEVGDIICFLNTGGYASSFEDASPHMHSLGNNYYAKKENEKWQIIKDN